ncbi:unnamed protein product [Pleuronectes platessa]|uniref:Uncharacterized protein n=1 Tax=Pleuronectes platessa TaxID=8262 RepID=A0A9N7V5A2_PLEPL|nr:unnamed protein product [Pleuronectes platessa]
MHTGSWCFGDDGVDFKRGGAKRQLFETTRCSPTCQELQHKALHQNLGVRIPPEAAPHLPSADRKHGTAAEVVNRIIQCHLVPGSRDFVTTSAEGTCPDHRQEEDRRVEKVLKRLSQANVLINRHESD